MIPITIQNELIKTIETMLPKITNGSSQSRDTPSVVANIRNDKYEVQVDGAAYWVKNGVGIPLLIGDPVWIHIPNGIMNDMFIMAKK